MQQLISILIILSLSVSAYAQKPRKELLVAFYNLENLFDTVNSKDTRDTEFTPEGKKNWNTDKYNDKLNNLSKVISGIGNEKGFDGPDILGVCEVENRQVLEDLIKNNLLEKQGYQISHFNSPDKRGIDVGLLYNPKKFKVESAKPYTLYLADPVTGNRIYTRDQLLVSGTFKKQELHIIVNHWPSRWGGERKSRPLRIAAAQLSRHIVDSLMKSDSLANIIIMGDLNDDPIDMSVEEYLFASGPIDSLQEKQLFNTSLELFNAGNGTLKYRGKWNLFDQLIISQSLTNSKVNKYVLEESVIIDDNYLLQQEGKYKGYPLRTFGGKTYLKGYSDHLPVYLILSKD